MPALSLRHKILIILACYIFGILAISVVSQEDLYTAKEKLEVVELAYSLNSQILEVRRYEKNFLLYGKQEALEENRNQLSLALETVKQVTSRGPRFKIHPMLIQLQNLINSYQTDLQLLTNKFHQRDGDLPDSLTERLRSQGQEMTELSSELVSFEHLQIRKILNELVEQLVIWSVVALAVGVFMPVVLSFKIFKPLRIMKEATEDIALGRFRPIEVLDTRDEMEQMMVAFNTMVEELRKRQDQLVQSQKLSSIGTLTAGIAHQLNNPLNNISTSCQIAMDDFEDGDVEFHRKMLTNIQQETLRARDVVQGLLEFSRAKEFSLLPIELHKVVSRSVKLVRSQVPSSTSIEIDIQKDLLVPMDAQRMQEVLLNMIINASQAISSEGKITISAGTSEDGQEAFIDIADNGEGIPESIKSRLFDPFYTTKDEGKGTGLGLSIAYGIIQKHNGEITVESSPGEGAVFRIHLPLQTETSGEGAA